MALVVIAQLLGQIPGLPYSQPADVEADTTGASQGPVNVFVPPLAGAAGYLTSEPVANSIIQQLITAFNLLPAGSTGLPCTVTISTGAGTLNVTTSQ